MFNLFTTVHASGAAGTQSAAGSAGMIATFLPIVAMLLLLYFMIIAPQKKQEKKMKKMLAALQVGDKVVTIGGICGKVSKLKDDYVYIETGFMANPNERTTIKMERAAIKTVVTVHED